MNFQRQSNHPAIHSIARSPCRDWRASIIKRRCSFWTLTVFDKAKGWLTSAFHQRFQNLMLHAAAREGLLCPIYCLMPDHLHLVWMGLRLDSDQVNGMAFLRTYLEPELSPRSSSLSRRMKFCVRSSETECVRQSLLLHRSESGAGGLIGVKKSGRSPAV